MSLKAKQQRDGFFKIPHWLIDSGFLALFKPNELKVWLVLKSHENFRDGTCFPGVELISKEAGINERLVSEATKALDNKGLIEKTYNGNKVTYKLKELTTSYLDSLLRKVQKRTGRYRIPPRGKKGRFITSTKQMCGDTPQNMEGVDPQIMDNPNPSFMESSHPENMDTKENKERDTYKENHLNKNIASFAGGSDEPQSFINHNKKLNTKKDASKEEVLKEADKESVKLMIQRRGVEWTKQYLRDKGYDGKLIETLEESS